MIYNNLGQTVEEAVLANNDVKSFCPECGQLLIPKMGKLNIWHWAHKVNRNSKCKVVETEWHLLMKNVYKSFKDWEIEVPYFTRGKIFRIDAMNKKLNEAREFIHSLSDTYVIKHYYLKQSGLNINWIWDGESFLKKGSYIKQDKNKNLILVAQLKPKAKSIFEKIGVILYFEESFWKHWKNRIWYYQYNKRISATLKKIDEFKKV